MELPRYRISRQIVCQQCSKMKVRCSRSFAGTACARCKTRRLPCSLASTTNSPRDGSSSSQPGPSGLSSVQSSFPANRTSGDSLAVHGAIDSTEPEDQRGSRTEWVPSSFLGVSSGVSSVCEVSQHDIACPIDAESISNRWLNPYIPASGQTAKTYDPTVTSFIHHMLKSYASVAVNKRGVPPFVHPTQVSGQGNCGPLGTCLNSVRLFENHTSADVGLMDFVRREMEQIFKNRLNPGLETGLAGYQAYLIYALVIHFWAGECEGHTMIQAMMQLQELAGIVARQGIVCPAEGQHTRPKREAWILVEAKRRAIYTMYLFDGLLSARDGLPSFLGTELKTLPAPACESLWCSITQTDWERQCNQFLADWPDGYLTIDELWPAPTDMGHSDNRRRSQRVEHWLEGVDKFGTMLYAVTSYIHKI